MQVRGRSEGPRAKIRGQRAEGRSPKVRGLLGAAEDPTVAGTPDAAGAAVGRVQPRTTATALDVEDVRIAAAAGQRLHADEQPLAFHLAAELKPEQRTGLGRHDRESELHGAAVDVRARGALREPELRDRDLEQVELGLLLA